MLAMQRWLHHAGPAYIVNKLFAANPAAMARQTRRSRRGKAAAAAMADRALNTKRRLGGGRAAGVGGDGSAAGGGDAAAADSRSGIRGSGVAGAAMWLLRFRTCAPSLPMQISAWIVSCVACVVHKQSWTLFSSPCGEGKGHSVSCRTKHPFYEIGVASGSDCEQLSLHSGTEGIH